MPRSFWLTYVAVENAERNGVAARAVCDTAPVELVHGEFAFVLANIEARVLIPLADAIAARVARGGTLVLSGILRGQEQDVRAAYPRLTLEATKLDGEWAALVLQRSTA